MKRIGPHVHTSGGVFNAPLNAKSVGATAFGLFTKNQRQWKVKPLDPSAIEQFKTNMELNGYCPGQVLVHDSYLINIGHPEEEQRERSLNALIDELSRCSSLGLLYLNIHPGSHLGKITEEQCLDNIAQSINSALKQTSGVTVVLENTAGQGSNVGYKFEHIAHIIRNVDDKSRIGFCIDTCHTYAAGYDISNFESYSETMDKIDSIIGFEYLRGAHLNDSKSKLGSKVDRHQSIGKGELGLKTFGYIMNDPRFDEIPLILETIDETLWPEEILKLYEMVNKG
ncbi:MAG: deoxyribonuclease IV [Fibrobacter sp.]|nr:deoxyribonuclease IV [Fibrobacter sp.]